jgi:hypothetical protein
VLACALLFPPGFAKAGLVRRIIVAATSYMATVLATLGLCSLAVRLTVGSWPLLGQLMVFQKTYAVIGFFMLPMPRMGLHWVIHLTFIAAVVVPIYETFSSVHLEIADNRRMINGSLAYAGVASFGPLAYYVGRSHHLVVEAVLLAWAFVMVQLLHRAWSSWPDTSGGPGAADNYLGAIPTVAIAGLFALILPMVLEVPNPATQVRRLMAHSRKADKSRTAYIELVRKYVGAEERAVIAYPNGHWLALKAGVVNGFPYANSESLVLKEQVNAIMAALARLPPREQYLFGAPMPELQSRLVEQGFVQLEAHGNFAVWSRNHQ